MLNVALTGNVAAGKSSVVRWFGRWGAAVIDSDALVREVQRPGTPTLRAMAERFGQRILRPDGSLDRATLRGIVLAKDGDLAELNAIVHPAVQQRRVELHAEAAPIIASLGAPKTRRSKQAGLRPTKMKACKRACP